MTVSGIKFGINERPELSSASSNAKLSAAFKSEVSVEEVSGTAVDELTSIGASDDVLTDSYGVCAGITLEASRLTGITTPASKL
jgi:hypothetical protein